MISVCAVIATNAEFLAGMLREKLREADMRVFTAATDADFAEKIKTAFPRIIFIEHCFHGYGTDDFIQQTARHYRSMRIVVWAASEVKPYAAARFIAAGAESFFSLRDTEKNIDDILCRIVRGQRYCPADVEELLDSEYVYPVIGEKVTKREIEVLKLMVEGKKNKEICEVLSMSVNTVKFHRKNIYRKCGGNSPLEVLKNGLKAGCIRPEELM